MAAESPSGTAPITNDGIQPIGPPDTPAPEPTVVDGDVMLQATLTDAPDSDAAAATVRALRAQVQEIAPESIVGGVTAVAIDTNDASIRDCNVIIPVVLLVIVVILALLLRSLLAPLLFLSTTLLFFCTAFGVVVLFFCLVF